MREQSVLRVKTISVLAGLFTLAHLAGMSNSGFAHPEGRPATEAASPVAEDEKLAELSKKIAGQEDKPAKEVFKNIQLLEKMPAGRFLLVMNSFSKSLGVSCSHCHVVDQWEKEDKPTKQIARDMLKMVTVINRDQLKNIENVKGEVSVTCWTCHRGQTAPEFRVPELKPKQ